jgi:hypothetical protein
MPFLERRKIMAIKEKIGNSLDGKQVYIIPENSHMEAHKTVKREHIAEAVSKVRIGDRAFLMETVDLGRTVGKNNCVQVPKTAETIVVLEKRKGRNYLSRMVYGMQPEDTSNITVGICLDDDGKFTIFTSFYGEVVPKELSDPSLKDEERPEAEAFWATHALIPE